jgi:hypothetical protein
VLGEIKDPNIDFPFSNYYLVGEGQWKYDWQGSL